MTEQDIFKTQDGSHSILSRQYGVSYHSKYGALQETQHVFIEAGLYPQVLNKNTLAILEIGFGTGLNALMTALEAQKKGLDISYEAIEKYPITEQQVDQLNYPEVIDGANVKYIFNALHEASWGEESRITPEFSLKKVQQDIAEVAYEEQFDLIYFDAFAPTAQPELWGSDIMELMYRALSAGGSMVTYCAKGAFKRTLKSVGFTVEALQGPPGKREMTRAVK